MTVFEHTSHIVLPCYFRFLHVRGKGVRACAVLLLCLPHCKQCETKRNKKWWEMRNRGEKRALGCYALTLTLLYKQRHAKIQ